MHGHSGARDCRPTFVAMSVIALGFVLPLSAATPISKAHKADTLDVVFDRIHTHSLSEAWERPDWKDEAIEAWLEKTAETVVKSIDDRVVTLPIYFKDTTTAKAKLEGIAESERWIGIRSSERWVGKNLNVRACQKSILLVDGNVQMSLAEDSIIIARGIVTISTARRCMIISGIQTTIEFDVENLVLSRGWVYVENGKGPIVVAQNGARFCDSTNVFLVNSIVDIPPLVPTELVVIRTKELPLGRIPTHPLQSKIRLHNILYDGKSLHRFSRVKAKPEGVLFEYEEMRYAAYIDKPIVDEAGGIVKALEKWKLTYVAGSIAMFTNGDAEVVIAFERE
jgi:hypothetical protein